MPFGLVDPKNAQTGRWLIPALVVFELVSDLIDAPRGHPEQPALTQDPRDLLRMKGLVWPATRMDIYGGLFPGFDEGVAATLDDASSASFVSEPCQKPVGDVVALPTK